MLRARFLLLLLLTGCSSPSWWAADHRIFEYRGYQVNVANHNLVREACWDYPVPLLLGCVSEKQKVAWGVPNYYALKHECHHIDMFVNGKGEAEHIPLDIFMIVTMLNEAFALATDWVPVNVADCGEGAVVVETYDHCTRLAAGDEDKQDACELRFETARAVAIREAF